MPDAYIFRRKKRSGRIPLVAGSILAAGLIALASLWYAGVFDTPQSPPPLDDSALPGSRIQAVSGLSSLSSPIEAAAIWKTTHALLADGSELLSSAQLATKDGMSPFETSGLLNASDQLLLLQHELEQDRHASFKDLQKAFAAHFVASDGLVEATDPGTGRLKSPADSLLYARLLAEGYVRWKDADLLAACRRTSDALLSEIGPDGLLPADRKTVLPTLELSPTPEPDTTATPAASGPTATPTPSPTPVPSPPISVLGLSQADFESMRLLSLLDSRWTKIYEANLAMVEGGFIGADLPLYAEAYSADLSGYVPYTGDTPTLDTQDALLVVLHLCETGHADPRSIAWLRRQVLDVRAVYTAYDLATGEASTHVECVPAYAIAARIARIIGDRDLYLASVDRILWNCATDTKSKAFGAVFQKDATGRVGVTAADNLWAMLALE